MIFTKIHLLPIILSLIVLMTFLLFKSSNKFYEWVEDHWFLRRRFQSKLGSVFYVIGLSLLLFGLMDLRGDEERITGKVSDQKTVVLIDNSASMLAEDVRPNRFKKSLLLVKHFVKKAVGHKISLSVFSDGVKKLVPFTDDYNLISARIETLNDLDLSRGGTGLNMAIQEAIQYFITIDGEPKGNIIIFTDGENTEDTIELNVPKGISIAVVGIGTAKGAPIPIRNRRGILTGNKKFKGKVVITKLDEKYLKKLGAKVENYRYWIATSYTLPTEQILSFFNKIFSIKSSQNDFRIRPVLANYLLIPGIVFLALSFMLGKRQVFIAMMLSVFSLGIGAQNIQPPEEVEEKDPVKSEHTLALEDLFANNKLSEVGKLSLATELLKDNFPKQSNDLYKEILKDKITQSTLNHHFNNATALLKQQNIKYAMSKYSEMLKFTKNNPTSKNLILESKIKKNILKAMQISDQQKKSKKSKDSKDSKNKEEKQNKSSDKDNQDDMKNKKPSDKKNDQKPEDQGEKNKNQEREKLAETNKEKKQRQKKLPAQLKQLISNDNQLQKKMIDAKTTTRKSRGKKDW